jgi:hypothetical protein
MPPPVPAPIRIERTPPGCAAALYEQRKVHHVGEFAILEDQLCSFTSDFDRAKSGYSPDRLDAACWALSELLLGAQMPSSFAMPIIISRPREMPYYTLCEPFPGSTW